MDPPSLGLSTTIGGRQPWSWAKDVPSPSPGHASCDADDAAGPGSPPAWRNPTANGTAYDEEPWAKSVNASRDGSETDEVDSGRKRFERVADIAHEVQIQRDALARNIASTPPPVQTSDRLPSPMQTTYQPTMTPAPRNDVSPHPRQLIEPTPGIDPRSATPRASTQASPHRSSRSLGSAAGSEEGMRVQSKQNSIPLSRGDVSLCVRLRPTSAGESSAVCSIESSGGVRLKPAPGAPPPRDASDGVYRCDKAFGPDSTQEMIYGQAVTPICEAVMRGYNGAVIAYGQTGSGKTHTMLGDTRQGSPNQGVAPRAVATIFEELQRLPQWRVEVSVLEIYNERVRDLLSPNPGVTHVDIHEMPGPNGSNTGVFRCPDATARPASNPEEAMVALQEGMRRRETAKTDMNHSSSRSHLIFSLSITQTDKEAGATLRSRLHIVDLAGSERLKRSMASQGSASFSARKTPGALSPRSPRDQQREACEINKSLSQLALVIQRLTTANTGHIPYRDSMLTRVLAESFGGSSKTCLIITASPLPEDREETKSSLDFGKRAKLVKNRAEINLECQFEPSMVFRAMLAQETEELQRQREALLIERNVAEQRRAEAERLLQDVQEATTACQAAAEQQAADLSQMQDEVAAANDKCEQHAAENLRLENDVSSMDETCKAQAVEIERLLVERSDLQQICEAQAAQAQEALIQRQALDDDNGRLERDNHEARRKNETQVVETARARQRSEELSQMLEQRAEESGRLEGQNGALQRKLEDMIRRSREQEALTSKLEAEKIGVHQQWHEAVAGAWRLMQEKAPQITHTTGSLSTFGVDDKSNVAAAPLPSKTREHQQSQDLLKEQDMARLQIEAEEVEQQATRQPPQTLESRPPQRAPADMRSPMFPGSLMSANIVDMIESRVAASTGQATDHSDVSSPSAPSVDDLSGPGAPRSAWQESQEHGDASASDLTPARSSDARSADDSEQSVDAALTDDSGLWKEKFAEKLRLAQPVERSLPKSRLWGSVHSSFGLPNGELLPEDFQEIVRCESFPSPVAANRSPRASPVASHRGEGGFDLR